MAFCKRADPGKVNTWKHNVSAGVALAHRQCPACSRKSTGGRTVIPEERLSVWRCRYCGHEISRTW